MVFRTGNINAIGDANDANQCFRYNVSLPGEPDANGNPTITGWLYVMKRYATKNQDDFTFDIGETVVCEMTADYREGVILGVINTKSYPPKQTDADTEQVTFSDGSIVSYDRKNHVYTVDIKGNNNQINITADGGAVAVNCKTATITASDSTKIDSKLEVTKDVTFDGKLTVTGDITTQGKVSATQDIETTGGDVKAPGAITLLTHIHPTSAPGSPTGTPIP